MKKVLVILSLLIAVVYFRHVPLALLLPKIDGVKYYSLFVSEGSTNGGRYYLYEYPYLTFTNEKDDKWRVCSTLHKSVLGYIQHFTEWPEIGPYYVVSKSTSNTYFAYIKVDNKIIYVEGFPDFGGAGPTEEEKNICAAGS